MKMRRGCGWAAVLSAAMLTTLAAAGVSSAQQNFKNLVTFDVADGGSPQAGMVQGLNGSLYGTTQVGGGNSWGTAFKITPAGTLDSLYSFCNPDCTTGFWPYDGLILATDGNFYGTTFGGGANGGGTVFEVTPEGIVTTIYSFCSQTNCADGENPYAGLVQATDGNFYGTTYYGGVNEFCDGTFDFGCGTVFKVTPEGNLKTLYSSKLSCADGAGPVAGLVQAADGNLYGTTYAGGANNNSNCAVSGDIGCGTIFGITSDGKFSTLYSFCAQTNCIDGGNPRGNLIQTANESFYGTTELGGSNAWCGNAYGCGTIFKLTLGGELTAIYNFCQSGPDCSDGGEPYAGLIEAGNGDFYGTSSIGGMLVFESCESGCGTVFKITPRGVLTTLHMFDFADGGFPTASLVQATDGVFYGTTSGGPTSYGTVFSLGVGLKPFIETLPASGSAGLRIYILGTDLAGASSVTFNGVPANYQVISSSEIQATVPPGAATGTVQVVTPRTTLSSNVPFRVFQ